MGDLLYSTLMLGRNKKIALEEYRTARGMKEPAVFRTEENLIEYSDVMGNTEGVIHLSLAIPGYIEIEAYCPDNFIVLDKKVVTTDEFADGQMEFPFRIISSRLHNGKNFARISFETSTQKVDVVITVNNKIRVFNEQNSHRETFCTLMEDYLGLRMGRLTTEEWQERALSELSHIDGSGPEDLYLMLYKAHVSMTTGLDMDAKYLIEFVAEQLHKLPEPNPELSSYFCYVKGLYELDPASTERTAGLIKRFYDKSPSWKILWMLFYLDSSYEEDPKMKFECIEEEFFEGGCSSPVMYFEALDILRSHPEFIDSANEFEIQVLYFGARYDYLNLEIAGHITEIILALSEKALTERNTKLLLKIAEKIYDRFPSTDALKAVCRLLILRQDRSNEAHAYYVKAVTSFIEIPELYNYYIFSLDKDSYEPLPQEIINYCVENESMLFDYKAYFLANIITNKDKYPELYRKCLPAITEFADEQLSAGITDESTAVIYKDLLERGTLSKGMKRNLFQIICTRKITTDNKRMKNVMVFHKELSVFQDIPLYEGRAYVRIYSPDAQILFKDSAGNLYANIEYSVKELVEYKEYIDLCIQDVPINKYMFIGDSLPLLREYKDPVEILDFMLDNFGGSQLRSSYEQELLCEMIAYFRRNSRDERVYGKLLEFLKFDLDTDTRGKIIEVMIEMSMFGDAYNEISANGTEGVAQESLDKLAHVLSEIADEPDELLTKICRDSFMASGFDPAVFGYLSKYYDGELEVLIDMYRAAVVYDLPYMDIIERIIRKAVETKEYPDILGRLFDEYYKDGEDEELKKEYLTVQAERYLYDGITKNTDFFKHFGEELLKGTDFKVSPMIGYLLYMRNQEDISPRLLKVIQGKIRDLSGMGIMLEEFKDYRKLFALPAALENAYVVSTLHFSDDGSRQLEPLTRESLTSGIPVITYDITSADGTIHCEEPMNEIFPGCFAKYFSLFYGEKLKYSIEEGKTVTVDYSDLHIVKDESRYSKLDEIIKIKASGEKQLLNRKAKEYFIRDRLIDKLF